ncbi:VirD4-like conjugal transfer protein, CD1115 family [Bacillus subtilis]|uniref:Type IV secretory system conjugative DNA transfer family protein n=1 Tax=Bacillus subtilis TaxID=1423 RepID=A0A8I1WGI1_BACIU|nr:type IV secretory system conjugative DNA transfer family protein [Bacillus subtilis]MBO3796502.1 type IV secretory system conjugative DNA transfer family protein [Bacillus subtilis]
MVKTKVATPNYMYSNGIVLGIKNNKVLAQPTNSKLPNRNQFVVGGPGSFKTQSYVVTNVLHEKECSIVVTDPKGEVYEMTAEVKKRQGYDVRVINFMDMAVSDRYNSFDYVRKDRDATTVANTYVAAKNDPKRKDIWYNSQLSLLKALLLYSIHEMPPEKRNMSGVLDFLQEFDPEQNEDGESALDDEFMKLPKRHPARRAYELGYKKSQEKTRSSIIISLLTTIGDYVDEEVAAFTSMSDFHLSDVGKKKIALYVIIPVMDSTWEGLINLFFNQMFQELYLLGSQHNSKLPQPVIFLLDEFPNLGRFDDYEKFLATCRGYGIACCTILQNITQLQEKYGKEQAESILGNCGVKLCLGNVNDTTAKYFSELAGKTTIRVETGSTSRSKGGKNDSSSHSDSYSYTSRSLINADEILTMNENESILIITGKYPTKLKKTKQFEMFPGITDKFRISQTEYKRWTSEEMLAFREEQKRKYEEYINSEKVQEERVQREEEIHQEKVARQEKAANSDEALAANFFSSFSVAETASEITEKDHDPDNLEQEDINAFLDVEPDSPTNDEKKEETAFFPTNDEKKEETAFFPMNDEEKEETAFFPMNDEEKEETAFFPMNDEEKEETAFFPMNDEEKEDTVSK